ncbi:protein scalloped isoform X2 [Bactrocera neohumeralis]|uniref:protein scalloped isoform X2 n=1 Tax=Bactrocera neohumeralis TaxID=98809 RepID=UPI0021665D13|nr:protein scalloped isoform X2 [Bactrocera neohumeralis]
MKNITSSSTCGSGLLQLQNNLSNSATNTSTIVGGSVIDDEDAILHESKQKDGIVGPGTITSPWPPMGAGPPGALGPADTNGSMVDSKNLDVGDMSDDEKDLSSADAEGVWSPDIEQSFQEALSIYPPCGRRKIILSDEGKMYGRNELIARYIKLRTGKTRTRKQVSSHIQVLARRKLREIQAKIKVEPNGIGGINGHAHSLHLLSEKEKALQAMSGMTSSQIVSAQAAKNLAYAASAAAFTAAGLHQPTHGAVGPPGAVPPLSPALPAPAATSATSSSSSATAAAAAAAAAAAHAYTHLHSPHTHSHHLHQHHHLNHLSQHHHNHHHHHHQHHPHHHPQHPHPHSASAHLPTHPHLPQVTSAGTLYLQQQHAAVVAAVAAAQVHQSTSGTATTTTATTPATASGVPHAAHAHAHTPLHHPPMYPGQFWQPGLQPSTSQDIKPFAQPPYPAGKPSTAVSGDIEAGLPPAQLPWEGRAIATHKFRLLEFSAFMEIQREEIYHRHLFVQLGGKPSFSDPLLETVDIRQISDKFPEKSGGLKDLYEKGPQNAFYLVKCWADLNTGRETGDFYGVTSQYESNENVVLVCSTKVCSFGKQVVEKVETEYSRLENGRFVYRIHRSPMCEYMINFIQKLKDLPERYMMNSVLENFTILQVMQARDTQETLLCIAYVFEVAEQNSGATHHIYRLIKE